MTYCVDHARFNADRETISRNGDRLPLSIVTGQGLAVKNRCGIKPLRYLYAAELDNAAITSDLLRALLFHFPFLICFYFYYALYVV